MTQPIPRTLYSGDRVPPTITPAWATYDVQWTAATTNPTLGNGTLSGWWRYIDDKMIAVRINLLVGSTTNVGVGQYRFSLPVNAVAGAPDPQLDAVALHGGALYRYVGWANTTTAAASIVNMYRSNINTAENLAAWTNAAPVALASGHSFSMSGFYFFA